MAHAGQTDGAAQSLCALALVATVDCLPVNLRLIARGKGHAVMHGHEGLLSA